MSEEAKRTLAEHVSVPAAVVDADGGVRYANAAFEAAFDVGTGAAVSDAFDDDRTEAGGTRAADAVEEVLAGAVDEATVEVAVAPTPAKIFHVRIVDVTSGDGAVVEACNVTAQLAETPRVGGLLDRISDAFYAVDDDWHVTYWNDRMADRTGIAANEVLGAALWDVFSDLEGSELKSFYESVMANGEHDTFRTYLEDPLGYWVEVRAYPDENGMSVFSRDVTADVERTRELERYETIVEHATDAVMLKDHDGRYRLANRRVAKYANRPVEDVLGRTDHELFGDEVGAEIRRRERRALDDEERITYEERLPTPDGEIVFETTRIPFYEHDELAGTIGICRDVTEEHAYRRRLEDRSEQLELLNRILRHDIRNDMAVVLAVLDLVGEYVTDDEGVDLVDEVRERGEHVVELTAILRDLMTVVLEDGDALQPVQLASVLQSELSDVDAAYPRAITRIDGDLPTVDVRANEMLHSVFRNLFKNAIQHNDQPLPEVAVSASLDDETVTVRVADNGPGIPEAQRRRMFDRDEKGLDSAGTGVGLFLVDRLVDEYGGTVHVEDGDPNGSVFVIELNRWGRDRGRA
jgi:PAS domain S-box-containing protein